MYKQHNNLVVGLVFEIQDLALRARSWISIQDLPLGYYPIFKEKRASFGSCTMWEHIGVSVSLRRSAGFAFHAQYLPRCREWLLHCKCLGSSGNHVVFLRRTIVQVRVPWRHRVIGWTEVKCVFSDIHYVFLLAVGLFLGSCCAFQINWEFWYISELSGSPTIMGEVCLIRRPLVAVWFYLSGHLIEKVGDLKTTAVALFLFPVSFLAISFISIPWLVLVVDILQAGGYALSYTGLTIHFSKPGSKASSAVILGKKATLIVIFNHIQLWRPIHVLTCAGWQHTVFAPHKIICKS